MFAMLIIGFIVLVTLVLNVRVVSQTDAVVIERLGSYLTIWQRGLNFKIPIIDRAVKTVSLKEQVANFEPQPVITKDNITIQIDTVVYFQVTDPKMYCYGVANPMSAIENLTATSLRNIIGKLELDGVLTSRDTVNSEMRLALDDATEPWGVKVTRVELKSVVPPEDIKQAMEKQMKAERERRSAILEAEGKKQAAILTAEGEKSARILNAEAQKQEQILAAEASKESQIRRAEGEASAIEQVATAQANAYKLLNDAAPNDQIIKIKGMEALVQASQGSANKIIIPTDVTGVIGSLTTLMSTNK
ncbi:SPFH domain-containing protein [Azotosporobacter soli]|uniref:SPFH domain-containing protein n=1 Tax=Azotosporobacter soli TaxID=3055040 RepID=UPI0031FF0C74